MNCWPGAALCPPVCLFEVMLLPMLCALKLSDMPRRLLPKLSRMLLWGEGAKLFG